MIKELRYLFPFFNETLTIEWNLGNTCTYSCSYCYDNLHDGSLPWIGFEKTKNFIEKIQEYATLNKKKYIIWQFSGGEPTVYNDFLRLCKFINSFKNNYCTLVSNGSRSIKWWEKAAENFMAVNISLHLEYNNTLHISKIADILSSHNVLTNVLVMLSKDKWNDGLQSIEVLKKSKRKDWAIRISNIKEFKNGEEISLNYTDEQKDFFKNPCIRDLSTINNLLPCSPDTRRTMLAIDNNNISSEFNPEHAIINNQSKWMGYKCMAGIDRLYINNDGNLHLGSNCRVESKEFTGFKFYEDFTFPQVPTVCTQYSCTCVSDILVPKYIA